MSTSHPDAPSFESSGLSVQEEKQKIDFQDGRHLVFRILTILAIFYLQVTPMLPTKFESIGLSVQEKKRQIDFQDGGHFGFPIRTILAILIYKSSQCSLPSFESTDLSVQEKPKIDFQDGSHGSHLGYLIGTIIAIFDLQVTSDTKFQLAFGFRRSKK